MFRVMKPGAIAYVCTPFMQGFHGYPSHFQNFTHVGHRRLFERAGFVVLENGVCVGPAWTLASIAAVFISEYSPKLLRWPLKAAWYAVATAFVRPLDHWLNKRDNALVRWMLGAAFDAGGQSRPHASLLRGPDGCTTREILEAPGWPAVSVPAIAKASKLTLQKEDGRSPARGAGLA